MSALSFRRRRRPAARHAGPAAPAEIYEVVEAGAAPAMEQPAAVSEVVAPAAPQPKTGPPPAVCLRAVTPDGVQADMMPLDGPPCFTGIGVTSDGRRYAGVVLASAGGGYVVLDSCDAGWFTDLIAELATARDELHYGGILGQVFGGAR